jgi:hypothetical protein
MSFHAVESGWLSHLSRALWSRPNNSLQTCNGGGGLHPSLDGNAGPIRGAIGGTSAASVRMRTLLWILSAVVYPPLFGHRFGACHAPCGNSLFCFG